MTRALVVALALAAFYASGAEALELRLTPPPPTEHGESTRFSVEILGAAGTAEVRWTFGDGTEAAFSAGTTVEHTYASSGHYSVIALARDSEGVASQAFVHAVHTPLTPERPRSSSSLVLDEDRDLVIVANSDNGTITLVDATTFEKVAEIPVFAHPVALAFAPDGLLWVLHQNDYAVAIVDVDARRATDFFRLPYASLPAGLVFAPDGDAYVSLLALGEVARIDSSTHEIVARRHIAPFLRGIAVSGDGASLWVTRFISSGDHGEVYRVDATTLDPIARYDLREDTTTEDSDVQGRGLPNYLFGVALSPDGTRAWIPAKKDNMSRGLRRDGLAGTQDNAVRPLVSLLDLTSDEEMVERRIDLDDRNLPQHVEFSAFGDWAFISVFGSDLVELRDVFTGAFVTALRPDGLKGPVASVVSRDGKLYVLADLARELFVFEVAPLMNGIDQSTVLLARTSLVASEKLPRDVLRGKQVFANAEDKRMASEGYQSCASCHFDGFEDGLVWDFFDRGEGFRNTISLLGRRGMGHGRVHWSANFDELQDFDGPIRAHQGGLGFISAEDLSVGTRREPLGDLKAGLDPDLDALAAYVTSLESIPRSPFRNADSTLTDAAVRGRTTFAALGCDGCHSGDDFTDSSEGQLHDVGTLTPLSGSRLGGVLAGIDTPTLLGVWQTAPYLHDGSAATLLDVLTTRNGDAKHGATAELSAAELDDLVAYLQQIDDGRPPEELTLPEPPAIDSPSGGEGGLGGSTSGDPDESVRGACGCELVGARERAPRITRIALSGMLLLVLYALRRGRRHRV